MGDGECPAGQACSPHGRCLVTEFDAAASANDGSPLDAATNDASASNDFALAEDLLAAPDLTPAGRCGDGRLDPGEACDEGANNSDDAMVPSGCTSQCKKRAACGSLTGASGTAFDPETGHCYVAWPGPLNWAAAEKACEAQGGALVSVDSAS